MREVKSLTVLSLSPSLQGLKFYFMECFDGFDEKEWLKKQLEEIFKPPTDDWDKLRAWVYRFGDEWDIFLIELTIPEF